jgi:hypothetical protein
MLAAVDSYTLIKFFPLPGHRLVVNVARLDLLLLASIVFMMVTKVGQ